MNGSQAQPNLVTLAEIYLRASPDTEPTSHLVVSECVNNPSVNDVNQSQLENQEPSSDCQHIDQSNQQDIKLRPRPCSRCMVRSISSVANIHCTTCHEWLCVDHSSLHSKEFDGSLHTVHHVEQINRDPDLAHRVRQSIAQSHYFPSYTCPMHRQSLIAFCVSCNIFVCSVCICPPLIQLIDQHHEHSNSMVNASSNAQHNADHSHHDCWSISDRWMTSCSSLIMSVLSHVRASCLHFKTSLLSKTPQSIRLRCTGSSSLVLLWANRGALR